LLKYLNPESGMIVTIVAGSFNVLATLMAAATFVPPLPPTKIPSILEKS